MFEVSEKTSVVRLLTTCENCRSKYLAFASLVKVLSAQLGPLSPRTQGVNLEKNPFTRRLFSCDISQANLPQAWPGSDREPPFPGASHYGNFLLASLGRP